MKYKILPAIFLASIIYVSAFAQSCSDLRYPIYTPDQIDSIGNLSYAGIKPVPDFYSTNDSLDARCTNGLGCDSSNAALVYDIYYPSTTVYTKYDIMPLPAVIIFHSGSFSDCSNKQRDSTRDYCKAFAQRGFIVFNVEYRRGRLLDGKKLSPEQLLAIYRAVQDGNGAIRSIVQRQVNNETTFKFDTSKLFLAGSSSGAIIALHIAFCNQTEMDSAYPGVSDPGVLGPVLKDDYYGASNISFSIKGVLSMWGALIGSGSSSPDFPACITSTDTIPLIAFHGEKDKTIPDSTINPVFSSGARAVVSQCDFTYHLTSAIHFDHQYGSIPIYNRLQSLNVPSELYLDSDAGHGLDSTSDYGLPTNNTDSVEDYIVARAAIFFEAILNNTTGNIKQTIFVDMEDTTSNCVNVLPVSIVNMNAYQQGSIVKVTWTSVSETNIAGYSIQRSADGINFTAIGSVQATGNNALQKVYSFNDMQPLPGNNYYRIQVADNERKTMYSKTAFINIIINKKDIVAYPVPAKNILHIQVNGTAIISLSDQGGKILITQTINNNAEINISRLAAGVYYLKNNTTGTTQKVVLSK